MDKLENTGNEIKRNPDGTIAKGSASLNPLGRPLGSRMTWQDYADRVDHFLTEYTRAEIKEIVLDQARFDKFVTRDALILQNIANSLQVDGGQERERLLSRVIGEAIKRSEFTGAGGAPLDSIVTLKVTSA
jgi:hypothetical protein